MHCCAYPAPRPRINPNLRKEIGRGEHLINDANPSDDFAYYNDDPDGFVQSPAKKKLPPFLAFLLLLVGGTYLVQTTLAANISLSSRATLEYGQGVAQTASCSGSTQLLITPTAGFTNGSGSSAKHYLTSVTVSNIPTSCDGFDFIFNAYGSTSSTRLALFNTSKTTATVWNVGAGSFKVGTESVGTSVNSGGSNNSWSFTLQFTNPVATTAQADKFTLQSAMHIPLNCSIDYDCNIGDTGPGGGIVFYSAASAYSSAVANGNTSLAETFKCGADAVPAATGTRDCRYLEWAGPTCYNGNSIWISSEALSPYNNSVSGTTNGNQVIGAGYVNTQNMMAWDRSLGISESSYGMNNPTWTPAAWFANHPEPYEGQCEGITPGFTDWYLGNILETNELCKFINGYTTSTYKASSAVQECTNSLPIVRTAYSIPGLGNYSTSVQQQTGRYYTLTVATAGYGTWKTNALLFTGSASSNRAYVFPIRAF